MCAMESDRQRLDDIKFSELIKSANDDYEILKNECKETEGYDIWELPCSMVICGRTGSGKTHFLGQLINDWRDDGYKIKVIIFSNGVQPMYKHFGADQVHLGLSKFNHVVRDNENLQSESLPKHERDHVLLVIDDLMDDAVKNQTVSDVMTNGVSHRGLSIVLLFQNILPQGKKQVTISTNARYRVFFKNNMVAKQLDDALKRMGEGKKYFIEMYNNLSNLPDRTCLVLDCENDLAWYSNAGDKRSLLCPESVIDLGGRE